MRFARVEALVCMCDPGRAGIPPSDHFLGDPGLGKGYHLNLDTAEFAVKNELHGTMTDFHLQ